MESLVCSTCGAILAPDDVYCSKCGTKTSFSQTIGLGRKLWIYFVSFFLPPFGLIWAWKYIRGQSSQAKKIGWIALILTAISIFLTVWVTMAFLQGIQSQINSVSNFPSLQGY